MWKSVKKSREKNAVSVDSKNKPFDSLKKR
jgi:hypothetical protein